MATPQDLVNADLNLATLDGVVTSDAESVPDRKGKQRLTLAQIERLAVGSAGFIPASGSFETGGTITERNQVLLRTTAPAAYFSWGGALPKVVPASSTVAGTGGEGVSAWTNRNDATFASQLADPDSEVLIAGVPAKDLVDGGSSSSTALAGVKDLTVVEGVIFNVTGFYAGKRSGGGQFIYLASQSKATHNGGTVIAPEAILAWSGAESDIATLLNWTGTGSGCFVRVNYDAIDPAMFGALEGAGDSSLSINKSFAAVPRNGKWSGSGTYSIYATVNCNGKKESEFDGLAMRMIMRANQVGLVIDNMEDCDFRLGAVMGVDGGFQPTEHPLILRSITGSTIEVKNTRFCAKGVLVDPIGDSGGVDPTRTVDGFYYNQVYLSKVGTSGTDHGVTITTTTNTLHPTSGLGKSYVNENEWWIKNIRCTGSGIRTIKSPTQSDRFNGNIFHNTGLEAVKGVGFDFSYVEGTHVILPRFEAPDSFGNFATALIRQDNTCSFNTYTLGRANPDRIILQGNRTTVKGMLIDTIGSNKGDEMYLTTDALPILFTSKSAKQGVSLAENYHEFIAGDTLATSNNLPYDKYAGYIKDSAGDVRPYGLLSPHDAFFINSFTDGQTVQATPSSYIRLRGGTAGQTINLRMNSKREIDGYYVILEIDTNITSVVNVQDSAGSLNVAATAFNPTTSDTRGMFLLMFRDFAWRASRIGDRLIAA